MIVMIILLILCLPLILMLSLYTTTNVVSIVADVPVTGIVLHMDKDEIPVLSFDNGDTFELDYTVMPQGATNKDVLYRFTDPLTDIEIDTFEVKDGVLVPKAPGRTKVTIETVDGGFRESFFIYVNTNRVTAIDSTVEKDSITVGETLSIKTAFTPSNASNQSLSYKVKEGSDVVTVSANGVIKGIGIGTAVIEVSSVDKPDVKDEITVEVVSSGVFDFVDTDEYLTVLEKSGSVDVILNSTLSGLSYEMEFINLTNETDPHEIINASLDLLTGKLEYEFISEDFVGEIQISLTVSADSGETDTKICSVHRLSDISIGWDELSAGKNQHTYSGETLVLEVNVQPKTADVSYFITAEFVKGTDLAGDVQSGTELKLEEGKKYTCEGGYISFMLDGNNIVIYGDKSVDSIDKVSDTLTKLHIVAVDNTTGETVDLGIKNITVIPS